MRVLIAEGDPISRRVLEATLSRWQYEPIVCCDGREAWEVYRQGKAPKLAILDWMMPEIDGIELCRMIRDAESDPNNYTYVILLTAKGRKEDVIEGLEAGADDYVVKPFDSQELRLRVRAARRILDLQANLIEAKQDLYIQATHDSLTGLWNRAAILDTCHRELTRGRREGHPVSVIVTDIDHFKSVNDSCGHQAGDAMLKEVAHRMAGATREYDAIGRYGGEEFLLVLPGVDHETALKRADRLRLNVADTPVIHGDNSLNVTISLGVSTAEVGRDYDLDNLISVADQALYRAKGEGRNCVRAGVAEEIAASRPAAAKSA